MKTNVHKRLARLAGLLALSLLVVATSVQAAQAASVQGSGVAVLSSEVTVQPQVPVTDGWLTVATKATDGWLTAGSVAAQSNASLPHPASGRVPAPSNPVGVTSSDGWTTVDWIGAGVGAAALLVVGFTIWALRRRPRPLGEPASVTSIAPPSPSSQRQPASAEDTQRRAA